MTNHDDDIVFRILVVCTGNTHRSPFAEALLRLRLDERDLSDIAVTSAGIGAVVGDPVPVDAVAAAAEWNLDLSGHRARQLDTALMSDADVILTMDQVHLTALITAFPAERERMHPMSIFDPGEDRSDIEDPADMDGEGLRRVYERIAGCAEEIADYYAAP